MNPNQIITPNSHKNVPPAVAEFLHRLKRLGKANSKKAGAILLCALALTGATKVIAESSAPSVPPQVIKVEGQQIALNDGRKMSFAELEKLPNKKELKQIAESMTDDQYNQFDTWQKNKYEEVMKDKARIEAETQRILQDNARLDAELLEAEKRKARELADEEAAIKKTTASIIQLESNVRKVLSAGGKLSKDQKETLEEIIAFGRPPETVKYFKEVVSNPNNFVSAK